MRVKKQKRHRRVVRFFTACFGFREPFKVLCDGTFIHHLLVHGLVPADDAVSRLLGGRCQLYATKCVSGELRSLGDSHSQTFRAAQDLITARCDHEKRVSAATCIEGAIAEGNTEHFFVATQDGDLRKKLREIPGIPVIYGLKNSLFLEKPSSEQREFVKYSEAKQLHMGEFEAQMIQKMKLKEESHMQVEAGSSDAYDGLTEVGTLEAPRKSKNPRRNLGVVDKVQFKRNRAKGPNPLSCKKKKVKENPTIAHNKNAEPGNVIKRRRCRKRRKPLNGSKHENSCN